MCEKKPSERERKLQNDKYDEAIDVSQSIDQSNVAMGKDSRQFSKDDKGSLQKDTEQSKSHGVLNKPFDEALEFSQSGSDDSVDTRLSERKNKPTINAKPLEELPDSKQVGPSSSYQKPAAAAPINQLQGNLTKQAVEKLVSQLCRILW